MPRARDVPPSMVGLWCLVALFACSGDDEPRANAGDVPAIVTSGTGAVPPSTGGAAAPTAGTSSAGTGAAGEAGAGAGANAGSGGAPPMGGTDAVAGTMAVDLPGATEPPPASCAEAARPYQVSVTALDPGLVAYTGNRSWAGASAGVPVAVDPGDDGIYLGFTRDDGGAGFSAVIARPGSTPADVFVISDAALGHIAATGGGVAALVFDPNSSVDERVWAAVARLDAAGQERFVTELFHSPNLEDEGTKGGASGGRLVHIPANDTLLAYFGHTQRYDDGVRHQGGYLATLDTAGAQTVLSPWFGSHNLEQRVLVDGSQVATLGLGDAYPKGIFFDYAEARPRTTVIYRLAADGVGSTNGQLGGMVDLGDVIAAPFITNRSVAQDLDAGTWPDIDESISMQIRAAAAAGTDLGLLLIPKDPMLGQGDLPPIWLDAQPTEGARLTSLKSAKYGPEMILLAWAEMTGSTRSSVATYFTMVIDRAGAVCQPKTPLAADQGFAAGDELAVRADGSIVWANTDAGRIRLVTLLP